MMLGTPAYMPPEQALAKADDIDARSDLWAVGATLFTLLSGHLVHVGDNGPQLLVQAATARARSLGSVAPSVPTAVARVVDGALSFDKASRWASAIEMREALREAYGSAFGGEPERGVLAAEVGGIAPSAVEKRAVASGELSVTGDASGTESFRGSPVLRQPADARLLTGRPVSTEAPAVALRGRRSAYYAAVGVAGVGLLSAVAVALLRPGGAPPKAEAGSAPASVSVAASVAESALAPASAPAPESSPASASTPTLMHAPTRAPTLAAGPPPLRSRRATRATRSTTTATSTSSRSASRAEAPPSVPSSTFASFGLG